MSIIVPPKPSPTGLKHLSYGKNDQVTDGPWMAGLAHHVNMLIGRRGKVLLSKFVPCDSSATFSSSTGTPNRAQFRTSPNCVDVYVMMLIARPSGALPTGYVWAVNGVNQDIRYIGSNSGVTFSGPGDLIVERQRFVDGSGNSLAGSTVHDVTMAGSGVSMPIVGYIVYELWAEVMDTAVSGLPLDVYSIGNPVLDRDISSITEALWEVYCEQGAQHIRWTDATGAPPTQTGATYKNILDATTTGFAASAAGFWTWPYRRNTLAGSTVDVTLWCRASATTALGEVRFSNSAGVIGTISVTGAAAYYTTTATLDTSLTSDLIIIEHANTTGGAATITTHAAGMYEYTI